MQEFTRKGRRLVLFMEEKEFEAVCKLGKYGKVGGVYFNSL